MDLEQIHSAASALWVVWFFVLFAGVIGWTLRPSRRRKFTAAAQIPLRDEE